MRPLKSTSETVIVGIDAAKIRKDAKHSKLILTEILTSMRIIVDLQMNKKNEIMEEQNKTPQMKAAEMAEAVKFCRQKNLMTEAEYLKATRGNREEVLEMACRAIIRKRLYLKAHPEEM